ncbi:Uncharacterized membrane protein YcaP, DUF421 family [Paenibacillus sp. UNCCL117]|uniref:DUF421 domain-containing protein n=1 Tax=unclassified Paenibacillus TaxID=185978 RepID=UPI00088DB03F|nr:MULTISPECIES: DUF421 domain-containing protein [unclassified Paenibacillus]SDC68171.1 Uncharacterized membrane protein YcaP, DUF421 family [Paenibacillus sp. cl123]SFW23533.1 Uncharacterized membrane protein YcaP, DUF421 family [Paenibacillus sp. UNCCL117]
MADWLHIAVRSFAAVVILFTITRLLGKKQISRLTFFEYIVGIAIGELAGFISTDLEAHITHGLIAIAVWFLIPFGIEALTLKSERLREWMEGRGTILIKEGKVLEDNLKKERYTADELMEQLRRKNVFQFADVEFAILETSGDLNVLLTRENRPLTPKHLGIKVAPEKQPQAVIVDGNIMDEQLASGGFSREWLQTELEKIGVTVENVFLAQADSYGQLTVDLYDDTLQVPKPSAKPLLLATLKKCEADLTLFGLSTKNPSAKTMYEDAAARMARIVQEAEPLLKS